jgi:hypothetical protein
MVKSGIYGLIDPRDGCLQYIGFTFNFNRRLSSHCSYRKLLTNTKKNSWIRALLKQGLKPRLVVLEEIPLTSDRKIDKQNLSLAEIVWIAIICVTGATLKNATDGGEGNPGTKHTKEWLARWSIHKAGALHPRQGVLHTVESKERNRVSNTGENSARAKTTWASVDAIRERYANENVSCRELGEAHGLQTATVWAIVKHKTWRR